MAPDIERGKYVHSAVALMDEASVLLTMAGSPRFSSRQWITLLAIGGVHFSSAICISLQAPFYPQEAELKGATATEYGLVFGSFELIAFITSPFFGRYVDSFGVKRLLNIGMVLAAISAILFGMLDFVMDHIWFISLSFLLRMTESLGSTSALVSAFSITAAVFPKAIGTTFASLEVFYGVGYIVGPTIGGIFYSIGGFKLPFLVNGLSMLVVAIIIVFILPPIVSETSNKSQVGILTFLKVPAILLNSIAVVGTSISMGYNSATLEPHLRLFNLSPVATGLMFVISGGTYACVAPIIGRICDRWVYPKRVIAIGCLLIMLSFTIVGPAPFIPLPTTLPLCIFALVMHGVGLACTLVPTFMDSICSAVSAGYSDDLNTYGILSGLWSASFSLGAFIGPSVAGILYDKVGFRSGTLFVIGVHLILFVVFNCFIMLEKHKSLPAHRVRLLSHRVDSNEEGFYPESINKSTSTNLLTPCWEDPCTPPPVRQNGYGSIHRCADIS